MVADDTGAVTEAFDVLDHRDRLSCGYRGTRTFLAWTPSRGPAFHSSRWDHSVVVAGQANRRDRHGIDRRADHRRARRQRPRAERLPAHRAVGVPVAESALLATHQGRCCGVARALNRLATASGRRFVRERLRPGDGRTGLAAETGVSAVSVESASVGARSRTAPQTHARLPRRCVNASWSAGHYYQSVQKPGVEVVTDAIDHIEPTRRRHRRRHAA